MEMELKNYSIDIEFPSIQKMNEYNAKQVHAEMEGNQEKISDILKNAQTGDLFQIVIDNYAVTGILIDDPESDKYPDFIRIAYNGRLSTCMLPCGIDNAYLFIKDSYTDEKADHKINEAFHEYMMEPDSRARLTFGQFKVAMYIGNKFVHRSLYDNYDERISNNDMEHIRKRMNIPDGILADDFRKAWNTKL